MTAFRQRQLDHVNILFAQFDYLMDVLFLCLLLSFVLTSAGGQYDGDKVDIWGLGCILYILLYGCNPFMQMNDNETLVR